MATARARRAGHAAGDGAARHRDRVVGMAGVRSRAGAHSSSGAVRSGRSDPRVRAAGRAGRGCARGGTGEGRSHARGWRHAPAGRHSPNTTAAAMRCFACRRGRAWSRAGQEVAQGATLVGVRPDGVTMRDAGGERRIALRGEPAGKAAPAVVASARVARNPACDAAGRIQGRGAAAQCRTVPGDHRQAGRLDGARGAGARRARRCATTADS